MLCDLKQCFLQETRASSLRLLLTKNKLRPIFPLDFKVLGVKEKNKNKNKVLGDF